MNHQEKEGFKEALLVDYSPLAGTWHVSSCFRPWQWYKIAVMQMSWSLAVLPASASCVACLWLVHVNLSLCPQF